MVSSPTSLPSPRAVAAPDLLTTEDLAASRSRPRAVSTESDDASKQRPSVPLLYASTISSLSTLSSTFYQYDSTTPLPTPTLTPSSMGSGPNVRQISAPRRKNTMLSPGGDSLMRLPPAQERALAADATRMARQLVAQQVAMLALTRGRSHQQRGVLVASTRDDCMRVYEQPGLGVARNKARSRKQSPAARRYTVYWRMHATVDEIAALLARSETYAHTQSVLSPETVHCKPLWLQDRSSSPERGDGDEDDVLRVDLNEDDGVPKDRSRAMSSAMKKSRKKDAGVGVGWLGINWWVQHMPNKLSRDRDLVVLEKQSEFLVSQAKHKRRRGFVHLRHSVDLAEASSGIDKKALSPFVRATMIQSGLVVVETEGAQEPGVVDLSYTLEMDFAGHLGLGQQRQLVVKRLLQLEKLHELLWQARLLRSQLLWMPRLEKSVTGGSGNKCERCSSRATLFSRRSLEPCKVCDAVVCGNCCNVWEFATSMVAVAAQTTYHHLNAEDDSDDRSMKARVCSHCVAEYSRPRLPRNQSTVDIQDDEDAILGGSDDDEEDDSDDEADGDHLPVPLPAALRRASAWEPSRSGCNAEELVDDFLMSLSAEELAPALPQRPALSPQPAQPPRKQSTPPAHAAQRPHGQSAPHPQSRPANAQPRSISQSRPVQPPQQLHPGDFSPAASSSWLRPRGTSRLYQNASTPSYSTMGGSQEPRRKRSVFERIPEPPPRKNVVLYDASA